MNIEVITGPTASGKTAHALERVGVDASIEIVNADASLIYRGFDIGTAKPSTDIRQRVVHHLIDILEPNEIFSAADYSRIARAKIIELIDSGKTPIVVGGTGFYIDALFNGIAELEADPMLLQSARVRVSEEMKSIGFDEMLEKLKNIDEELYVQIDRERNPRRLERAWEFYYATGTPLGIARKKKSEPFRFLPEYKVLTIPKEELWIRIENRVDSMIENGWPKEVESLLSSGITMDMPAMKAIGYREMGAVISGERKMGEARSEIIFRTRQYAKRQITWMKKYRADAI